MNRMVLRSWPLAAACLLLLACCPAFTAEPSFTKSTIFEAGQGGYVMYRIPGIVVTKRGTVLVYNEARRNSGSDWGTIDIVMRRSTDGRRDIFTRACTGARSDTDHPQSRGD